MADAVGFLEDLVAVLWLALAIAIAVFAVAGLRVALGPVSRRIDAWMLPRLTRRERRRHGLAPDASPWACLPCGSLNLPTAAAR